jgi:hypothetical protein
MTRLQQCGGYVRTADGPPTARFLQQALPLDGKAQIGQPGQHLLRSFTTSLANASQECLEVKIVKVHKVAQEMDLLATGEGTDLHARYHRDPVASGLGQGHCQPFRSVVVGDAQYFKTQPRRLGYQFAWCQVTI